MNVDLTSTVKALELYADSKPHTANERQLLKLITIGGKTALTCISEKEMTTGERLASFFGFGSYKLRKITDFLSSKEFCEALNKEGLEKNLDKLKKATTDLETGISTHNSKPWFFRITIRSDLHGMRNILNNKVIRSAQPIIQPVPEEITPPTKAEVECKRLETSKTPSAVELRFVMRLAPNLSPLDIIKAQVTALKNLKPELQNDDKEISKAKEEAVLKACKTTGKKWAGAISTLENAYREACTAIPPKDATNTRGIANLAHKQLQIVLSQAVKEGLDELVDKKIDALKKPLANKDTWNKTAHLLTSQTKTYVELCKEALEPRYAFYEKWAAHHKAEMIQGFVDPGETLGAGICWALSLRWCIAELERSNTFDVQDMVSTMDIGSSTDRDRFNQAFLQVIKRGSAVDSPELEIIKKRHNIVKTHRFDWGKDIKADDLQQVLMKHLQGNDLIANRGVGQLCFWWKDTAHAISICCQPDQNDPQRSVFRFSDPNLGTFHFAVPAGEHQHNKTLNKFAECLSELLTIFYGGDFNKISCFCFEQAPPPAGVK